MVKSNNSILIALVLIILSCVVMAQTDGDSTVAEEFGPTSTPVLTAETAELPLSMQSTSDEVLAALSAADEQYITLHVRITTEEAMRTLVDEVRLSQITGQLRWETDIYIEDELVMSNLQVSDGEFAFIREAFFPEGTVVRILWPPEEVIRNLGLVTTMIAPSNLVHSITTSDRSIEIIELVELMERPTLHVRVRPANGLTGRQLWVDVETGLLLKFVGEAPDGSIFTQSTIEYLTFDVEWTEEEQDDLFYVDRSAYDPDALREIFPPAPQPTASSSVPKE